MSDLKSHESINVPLHRKIADALSQRVTSGGLRPGQRLPSERSIALEYQASRATVRTALQHLEQSGLIARRERRSAVVAFRRTSSPSIRIACGSLRLLQLFRRLGELQKLPARFQLHYVDLQQGDAVNQVVSHPAESADLLICDLHDLGCFTKSPERYFHIPRTELTDSKLAPVLQRLFTQNNHCRAVGLGLWPAVIFTNHRLLDAVSNYPTKLSRWQWGQLNETIETLKSSSLDYAFQFRSSFVHLSALMESMGASLYNDQGRLSPSEDSTFNHMLRFIYCCLHENKTTPLLAKAEQVNLFADQRCPLALDGLNMYAAYRAKLGEQLGITQLPRPTGETSEPLYGFGAVVFPDANTREPAIDLIRSLLSPASQRVMHQLCGSLPVRSDMLTFESLGRLGFPEGLARFVLEKFSSCHLPNPPDQADYKEAVESLFLELWLGLDRLDNLSHRFAQLEKTV
jgi:hypothetical protein